MRKFPSLCLLPLTFACIANVAADTSLPTYDENAPVVYPQSGFYFSVGQANFDSATAAAEGVDDTATALRAVWEAQKGALLYGVGLGLYFYDDNERISELVVDNSGRYSTADSTAMGFTLIGELGYAHPLSNVVQLEAVGGVELMWSSERSIDYCSNCTEQDINIDGGVFFMPRVRFSTADAFSFSLSFQQYLTGDIDNAVAAHFSWRR